MCIRDREHGVSRVTVRRALDTLASEGMIERRHGAGTFVCGINADRPVIADFSNVMAHLIAMGYKTGVRLLSFGYGAASPAIAQELRLDPGERVQRSIRVRLIDGQPFSYLITHVPERIGLSYSEADLASRPLLELLECSGLVAARATQKISATIAGPEVAAALDLDIGAALLALTRIVFDLSDRGIEHLQAYYRPDRYSFHMALERTGDDSARRWTPASQPPPAAQNRNRNKKTLTTHRRRKP